MARQLQAKRMRSWKSKSGTSKRRKTITSSTRSLATRGVNPNRITTVRGFGFPDNLRTRLVYSTSVSLVPTGIAPCPSYGFRLTSLYDPDLTGIGGQPYWYDQLTSIYARYKVLGAKMTAIFSYSNETVAGVGPTLCGIEQGEISGLSSTDGGVLRMTNNVSSDILSVSSEPKTVVATYSPKQAFGSQLFDALTADKGANPGRNWNGFVFANPQGTDVTKPINCFVTIEYFAEFTQQYQNAGS